MKVNELIEKISLECVAGNDGLSNEITGCYIGDLLSLAMAKVEEGNIWITVQTNINIVAVASLKDVACIIISDGFLPDKNTAERADKEGIAIISAPDSAYELAKKLSELGI